MSDKSLDKSLREALAEELPRNTSWLPAAKCSPAMRERLERAAEKQGISLSAAMRSAVRLFTEAVEDDQVLPANE